MPQQATNKVGDIVRVRCFSFSAPVWSFSNFEQKEFADVSSDGHAPLTIEVQAASRGMYECKGTTYVYGNYFLAQFFLTVMGKN